MTTDKYLLVIGGPTASGKTALAIQLAQHFRTDILSCDSRQFYREMHIGTAKPTAEERAAAPHHFIDSLSIEQPWSVGDYERAALALLRKIYAQKNVVILVGGSGLFIRAVCEGFDEFPEVPEAVSREVRALFREKGLEALQSELARLDPAWFEKVDRQNPVRLMRAIAVSRAAGQPYSSFLNREKQPRFFKPIYIMTDVNRAVLYEKINQRVDRMIEQGLVEEARKLFPKRHLNALQTVGYKELFQYFAGNISLEKAIELIKRNTRRYAKRQLTWFRNDGKFHPFPPEKTDDIIAFIRAEMLPDLSVY
ncbi:MAG: tRNA (adenosine(37)-N6)-dimethylallyltransferase MiaA [Bacteroidetes bacterium]|nr:MAG: tRNA (adenosine(37)-N6)-dimethylallyltransferase MiaA [Bacteroidota bacterium]